MGSSSVSAAERLGHDLRWGLLLVLTAVSVAFGWSSRRLVSQRLIALVGGLGAVGLLSTVWSVHPRITGERALTFVFLTAVAALVAGGALRSPRRLEVV